MKTSQRPQRRNSQQSGPGSSLFPFLAVLICTMGALVPLLLAITRIARQQAEAAAVAKAAERGSQVETQREDVRWRIEQLKQSRVQTESQLADARLELGHLEDHSRRLRDTLAKYERTFNDLKAAEGADQQRQAQSLDELKRVHAEIDVARQQLAQAGQVAAGRSRSFAVVPYEGPNQTRRRPIYLECRADAVVLQPEGIALRESDFDGPLGPGNPLAVALRAAREYMLAQRNIDPQAGEPYPLLLVRPEGINAYYAARMAMKSWGFDFGYELIDDGWKLAYPSPDPRLADIVRQVVSSARATQARLVAAAPRYYGGQGDATSGAVGGGGVAGDEGVSGDDGGYVSAGSAGLVGRATGGQGSGVRGQGSGVGGHGVAGNPHYGSAEGTGTPGGGGQGSGVASPALGGGGRGRVGNPDYATTVSPGNVGDDGQGGEGRGSGGQGVAGNSHYGVANGEGGGVGVSTSGHPLRGGGVAGSGNGQQAATGDGTESGNPYRGSAGSGGTGIPGGVAGSPGGVPSQGGSPGVAGSAASSASGSAASRAETIEHPDGYVVGQPPREQPAHTESNESSPPAGMVRGRVMRPGEWEPTPDPLPEKHEDKPDNDKKPPGRPPKSLVDKRGADWGLRDVARSSVGITRPIRIECYADRLVVKSERGLNSDKAVRLGPRTASSIDPFISAVWEHMEAWGIAGRSMYWRPLLQVHVAPDAEQRFADLSVLLRGSGLMVERK